MFTHQEIIDKLTTEQKLSLLADVSALGKVETEADVRFLSEAFLSDVNKSQTAKTVYPSFNELTNSWSVDMIGKVAERLAIRAKKGGNTLLNVPTAKVKTTPYSVGFSEDPFLSGTLAGACITAASRVGIKTCISDPTMTQEDVDYSDLQADMRSVKGYFLKPFDIVAKYGVSAMQTDALPLKGSYEKVNAQSIEALKEKTTMIYRCQKPDDVLKYAREEGGLCKNGSVAVLKTALERYQTLQKAFEAGEVSLSEVETECREGNALSMEMLDGAVDRILDFTLDCAKSSAKASPSLQGDEEELAFNAAAESIVLLKNEKNVLPLTRKRKMALIGGLADYTEDIRQESIYKQILSLSQNKKLNCIGFAKGYNVEEDRSDNLIREACDLARQADVVLVVIGYHAAGSERARRNKNSLLPANQLALLQALSRLNKEVVAVVVGDCYPDMKFDKACSGVMLAPFGGTKTAKAICGALVGQVNPSGKLAFTCYNSTDEHFGELRAYKDAGRNKIGSFYGYRHYDISALRVKYPFGYGLSYTKFGYSRMQVSSNGISFTVRNTGKKAGSEVVQIYIGKKKSSIIRPAKELKAFVKVFLKPGRSKRVTVSFKQLDLSVWDNNKFVTESGTYEVYVGAASNDIKLQGIFFMNGTVLKKEKGRYSDYLQARSNIHAGQYYLDPPSQPLRDKNTRRQKAAVIGVIVMICLDIIYAYFNYVRWAPKTWWMYLAIATANALPICFTALYTVKKQKSLIKYREDKMNEKLKQREKLNVEDLADEIPFEQLFEEEFAVVRRVEKEEDFVEEKEERLIVTKEFDKTFTVSTACQQLVSFLYERGVAIDLQTARTLFAAFASSRLLIVKSEEQELLNKLLPLLSEYFGSESAVETFAGEEERSEILYRNGEATQIAKKIMSASLSDDCMHVACLQGLQANGLRVALAPLVRYVDQPEREAQVLIKTSITESNTYTVAENVWFVVALDKEDKVTDIPKYLLDMACVLELLLKEGAITTRLVVENASENEAIEEAANAEDAATGTVDTEEEQPKQPKDIKVVETEIEQEKTPITQVYYSQFSGMCKNAFREKQIDEILWKRVDKLEEYANACNEYRIENKMWQRMEKYVSALLSAGSVEEEALDCVVAHHLVYGILATLKESKKPLEEKFSHTLENIFGEGNVPQSLKAVRTEGLEL